MSRLARSGALVVIAEFEIRQVELDAFLAVALDDARHSVQDEPGCQQFDVIVTDEATPTVVFYEVYEDKAAFDLHLQTPHLQRFRNAFPALIVAERQVRFARLVSDD